MSSRVKTKSRQQRAAPRQSGRPQDWLRELHRESLENAVSALIDLLDAMDASSEDLETDEDCCAAGDDDLGRRRPEGRAGDPQQGEPAEIPPRRGGPAANLAEEGETWIGQRVDGKGTPVLVRRRRVIAAD